MKRTTLAVLAIAGTVSASYADPIVFINDNPDYATLRPGNDFEPPQGLNIGVAPMDEDPDVYTGPGVLTLQSYSGNSGQLNYVSLNWQTATTRVALQADPYSAGSGQYQGSVPLLVAPGDAIGPATHDWDVNNVPFPYRSCFLYGNLEANYYFPSGYDLAIAVRFLLDDGYHYGFVEFTLRGLDAANEGATRRTPMRWGYESEPDTPFVVPSLCPADLAEPFGTLNFFDVSAFLNGTWFVAGWG